MKKQTVVPSHFLKAGLALSLILPGGVKAADPVNLQPSSNYDLFQRSVPDKIDALDGAVRSERDKGDSDKDSTYNSLTPEQKKIVDEIAKMDAIAQGSAEYKRLVKEAKKIKYAGDLVHKKLEDEAKKSRGDAKSQLELADKLQQNPGSGMSSSASVVDTDKKVKEPTCQGTDVTAFKNAAAAFEQFTGKVAAYIRPGAEKNAAQLEKDLDDLVADAKKRKLQELHKKKNKDFNKVMKELTDMAKSKEDLNNAINQAIEELTEANKKERERTMLAMYDDIAKLGKVRLKQMKLGIIVSKIAEDFSKYARDVVNGLSEVRDQNIAALDAMESKSKKDSNQVVKGMKLDGGFSSAAIKAEQDDVKKMIASVDRTRGTADPAATLNARLNEHKNTIGKDKKNPDAVANNTIDAAKAFTSDVEAEARKVEKIALACDKLAKKSKERLEEETRAEMVDVAKKGFSQRAAQEAQVAQQQQQENAQISLMMSGAGGGMTSGMGMMGAPSMPNAPQTHGAPNGPMGGGNFGR